MCERSGFVSGQEGLELIGQVVSKTDHFKGFHGFGYDELFLRGNKQDDSLLVSYNSLKKIDLGALAYLIQSDEGVNNRLRMSDRKRFAIVIEQTGSESYVQDEDVSNAFEEILNDKVVLCDALQYADKLNAVDKFSTQFETAIAIEEEKHKELNSTFDIFGLKLDRDGSFHYEVSSLDRTVRSYYTSQLTNNVVVTNSYASNNFRFSLFEQSKDRYKDAEDVRSFVPEKVSYDLISFVGENYEHDSFGDLTGVYYTKNKVSGLYLACDNSKGFGNVEEFRHFTPAEKWLKGESLGTCVRLDQKITEKRDLQNKTDVKILER